MSDDFFGGIGDALVDVTDSLSGSIANIATGALAGAAAGAIGGLMGRFNTLDPNLVLSSYRSYGIPVGAEAEYSYAPTNSRFQISPGQLDWRVSIFSPIILEADALSPLIETNGMIFPYLPSISFQSAASYDPIPLTHSNFPFLAYRNSRVDDITITGSFTVQDQNEGVYWLAVMHFLRTVTKMYTGNGPNLGNPPEICTLNGYGDFVFNNVSCVIKQFSINFQKDVDYISVIGQGGMSYVPTRSEITIVVAPTYSRDKTKTFNLTDFANGQLVSGFDGKGWL
jgi:hypothetical protein